MNFQQHLLENVFRGDTERFTKAWQEALDEGCDGAVSWKTVIATTTAEPVLTAADYQAIKPAFEGLKHTIQPCTYAPYTSYFIWINPGRSI